MEFNNFTLPNGIRCIHCQVKSSPVAHCGLTIGAGSRDELAHEHGLAHFIEHSIFKGTKKRKAFHINNRLDNLGGELNAFTTKEETVIHATTLKSDFSKAAELISDVVFNSVFPAKEIDREKDIIFDEINSYKDSPSEQIYDDFEDLIFANSPLGHPILGNKRSLAKFDATAIHNFMERTYATDQMVFSAVSSISHKRFQDTCYKYFADFAENRRPSQRDLIPDYVPFSISKSKGTFQTHCTLGSRAYSNSDPRRVVLSLLVNLVGGPSANSLLNLSLREKHGLSYNIEAGYTPYSDSGIVNIYFGTDKNQLDRCLELVDNELKKVCAGGITARALSIAKKQFVGQLAISMESNEGYMLAAGKSILVYNEIDNMDKIAKKIMSITHTEITDVANEIFGTNISNLTYK